VRDGRPTAERPRLDASFQTCSTFRPPRTAGRWTCDCAAAFVLTARHPATQRLAVIVLALLAIGLWAAIHTRGSAPSLMVSPLEVARAFGAMLASGQLTSAVLISSRRVFIGFAFALAIALPLGVIFGYHRSLGATFLPINSFLRYIPPTAFTGLLILRFGIDEAFKYSIVFVGVVFFMIQMIADAVSSVDRHYVEMARVSGFTRWSILSRVVLPLSAPSIVDAIRVNLGAAWTFLVVAELVGSDSGLGFLLAVSQRFFRVADMYAVIVTFGIIGYVIDSVVSMLTLSAFRWHRIRLRSEHA
jgi:NitT/TauT family transport system permease protein